MIDDTGDETLVEEQDKKAKLAEEQNVSELQWLLSTKAGRYFIWRILCECGVFQTLSMMDTHHMAIRSGRRDVGLWIMEQIFNADNNAFFKMQNEAKDREET